MAHDLLLNVYEEYKKFCERSRRELRIVDPNAVMVNGVLQVKKNEIVTGRRTAVQPLPNTYQANPQSAPTTANSSFGQKKETVSPQGRLNQASQSFVPAGKVSTNSMPFVPH